jgi:hypothetical protein
MGAYLGVVIFLPPRWYPLKIMLMAPFVLGLSMETYEQVRDRWPRFKVAGWLLAFLVFWSGVSQL